MIRSKSGQATLEYVLLLLIIVAIGFGALWQLNSAFRSFADSYFGDYLTCLLQTGELPALGGDVQPGEVCDAEFVEFSLANGRSRRSPQPPPSTPIAELPPSEPISSSSSSDSSSRSDPSSSQSSLSTPGSSAFDGGSGRSHNSRSSLGGAGGTGAGRLGGGIFGSGNRNVPLSSGETEAYRKAKGSGALDVSGGVGGKRLAQDSSGRLRYVPVYEEIESSEDAGLLRPKRQYAGKLTEGLRNKRVPIPDRKPSSKPEADTGITFPDFIRYIIIAAIALMIFVFFGGQIYQFSKSYEKE